jgi:hypothetical protein
MGTTARCGPATGGVLWADGELHVGKVAEMLTSWSRSTETSPDAGTRSTALPRRVPGASFADPDAVAAAAAVLETSAGLRAGRVTRDDAVDDGPVEVALADLPDVSGLLARLVEDRIPMALMIDLVNPTGPGPDVDEARRDVE